MSQNAESWRLQRSVCCTIIEPVKWGRGAPLGKHLRDYAQYGSVGISWVMVSLVYVYLGYRGGGWLDERLGTAPVFMLLGLVTGVLLSVISLINQLLHIEKQLKGRKAPGAACRTNARTEGKCDRQ